MAETDFHTEPESPDVTPETPKTDADELRELLEAHSEILDGLSRTVGRIAETLDVMASTIGRAAPLLESRAAKIALGAERHPVLAALGKKGAGRG